MRAGAIGLGLGRGPSWGVTSETPPEMPLDLTSLPPAAFAPTPFDYLDPVSLAAKQQADAQIAPEQLQGPTLDVSGMDPAAIAAADQAAEDPQDPGVPVAGASQDVPTVIPPAQSATAFDETGDPLVDELSAQADALQISALSASPFQTLVVHRGNGLSATGGYPSDSTGAVGPRYYVEMVNSRIVVYRRADLARVAGPLSFQAFTRVNPADRMPDPQIQWDPVAHRWFYVIDRFPPPGGGANTLEYGWSKTSSPRPLTTGWCHKRYTTRGAPGIYDDFPKLGHSDTSLLFGTLRITPNVKPIIFAPHIFVISKPPAGAAGSDCAHVNLHVSVMGGLTPTGFGAPVPINPVGHAPGLLVAAQRGGGAELAMWRVRYGPKGRPNLVSSTIPVAPYAVPPNVPQPNAIDPRTRKRLFIDSRGAELTQAIAARDPLAGCPLTGCAPGSRPPGALAIWTQQTVALEFQSATSTLRWPGMSCCPTRPAARACARPET